MNTIVIISILEFLVILGMLIMGWVMATLD